MNRGPVNSGAAIYRTSISHVRRTPLHNAFTYRSYSWYVDVDALPEPFWPPGPLAWPSTAATTRDPDGMPGAAINVERHLATRH